MWETAVAEATLPAKDLERAKTRQSAKPHVAAAELHSNIDYVGSSPEAYTNKSDCGGADVPWMISVWFALRKRRPTSIAARLGQAKRSGSVLMGTAMSAPVY